MTWEQSSPIRNPQSAIRNLPPRPDLPPPVARQVRDDFERFARDGLPADVEGYLRATYGLDVSATYAGRPVRNPWGKASGQLSMRLAQVEEAAEAGLGFVVLKTVIAQDERGARSMADWAIKEARMVPERIVGASGVEGWTVTWKGRGWWQPFEEYLDLVRAATALGQGRGMLIVPSVKYHLPAPGEEGWRVEEYVATTRRLLDAYAEGGGVEPMPLEKDFSPTLAGSSRSAQQAKVLEWLTTIPRLIRDAAAPRSVAVGLKLFNALFDDAFQLAMLGAVHGPGRPDFLVYANRLFDPDREFEGHRGVAYGGPDLSDRNLRALSAFRAAQADGTIAAEPALEMSATGDIGSGRVAVEYALRGCANFQVHTFFQLPMDVYPMGRGSRLQRALHALYFDPDDGLVAWMLHVAQRLGIAPRVLDLATIGAKSRPGDLDAELA